MSLKIALFPGTFYNISELPGNLRQQERHENEDINR